MRKRIQNAACVLGVFFPLAVSAFTGVSLQMQLGNPSNATSNTNDHNHYLIQRSVETLDYSDRFGQPNWASWNLSLEDIGNTTRTTSFYTDRNLPANFERVVTGDYTHSGYQRGHLCPSKDRSANSIDNQAVFYLSNIIPQTRDNNEGPWKEFEEECRKMAQLGYEALIICGPGGFSYAHIDAKRPIYIPLYVWKIAVFVPHGKGDAVSRIDSSTDVVAINIPNISGIYDDSWTNYITSALKLESLTGLTFFSALPPETVMILRAKIKGTPAPLITSFSPQAGNHGEQILISGRGFSTTCYVKLENKTATFTVNSDTQITAIIPSGVSTGKLSVITAGGLTTTSNGFCFSPQPKIRHCSQDNWIVEIFKEFTVQIIALLTFFLFPIIQYCLLKYFSRRKAVPELWYLPKYGFRLVIRNSSGRHILTNVRILTRIRSIVPISPGASTKTFVDQTLVDQEDLFTFPRTDQVMVCFKLERTADSSRFVFTDKLGHPNQTFDFTQFDLLICDYAANVKNLFNFNITVTKRAELNTSDMSAILKIVENAPDNERQFRLTRVRDVT